MILFLDFDGVLHPEHVYLVRGRPTLHGGGHLFEHAGKLVDVLADFPKIRIVLSTSWVPVLGFSFAKDCLPQGLQDRIIGATWHSHFIQDGITKDVWKNTSRFRQIMRYVHRNVGRGPWLAIDDDIEGWGEEFFENLIACDGENGLGDDETIDALYARLSKSIEMDRP